MSNLSPKSPTATRLANAVKRVAMASSIAAPVEAKKKEALECHYIFEISHGTGFRYIKRAYKGFFVEAVILASPDAFTALSPQAVSAHELTQASRPHDGATRWNHLVDLHYAVVSAAAPWPKLRLKICLLDADGRVLPVGYALAALPSQPGPFRLDVACWRPVGSGLFQELRARISGAAPGGLGDLSVVEAAVARKALRTVGCGSITLSGELVLRRADMHGVAAKPKAG